MSNGLEPNFEYMAAHASDYIANGMLFSVYDEEDIPKILKHAKLTTDEYISLIKQSTTKLKARRLYTYTHTTSISINNLADAITFLKSIKKHMKLGILSGVIAILNKTSQEIEDSSKKFQKIENSLAELQKKVDQISEENKMLKKEIIDISYSEKFLTKIASYKRSDDFNAIYQFLDDISKSRNQRKLMKAFQEGLCDKKGDDNRVALHEAAANGNLRLVKALVQTGCNIEVKTDNESTPLI